MDLIELLGLGIILGPVKELIESMRSSKALTIMVIFGLTVFVGFTFFLFEMASMQ
ncbi:hypothetical protein [Alteromonas sp. S015]|uniref:hypothetical protein n=1 Tax=Alteromonas sp. S015 TaxID=3117401 RepID=UPI002FE20ACD